MEHQRVWNLVLRWLFECYEPPYVAPPPVEGAQFDPIDYGRLQYVDLVRALQPVRRPPPRPPSPEYRPLSWGFTDEELEAMLED